MGKNLSTRQLTRRAELRYNRRMDTMVELYSPGEISRLEKKQKSWRIVFWTLAAAALAGCVGLCLHTRTANESAMERAVIALSVLVGWAEIYIRRFVIAETGHELAHARMLRAGDGAEAEGVLTVTKERLRIKNSVAVRIAVLEEGGRTTRLRVIESKVRALAPLSGQRVRLRIANGYIAGWKKP